VTGLDQLQYLSWLLYLFVFVAVLARTIRRPTPAHLDMTLFFGAVAILIVFAILLTRGSETPQPSILSPSWLGGIAVAVLVFGVLAMTIVRSSVTDRHLPAAPQISVHQLGEQLMTKYLLPLEVIGLLLTAALIGAVIIAMQEKETK